jgi:hypothetical protein
MSTVEDLERKVQSLRGQLEQAERSLYRARLEASGLVPQVTVLIHRDKECRFVSVRSFTISKKPWVYVQLKNKDGNWSERETLIYDNWSVKP